MSDKRMTSPAVRAARAPVEPVAAPGTHATPLLVAEAPHMVKRETKLTDGQHGYVVVDHAKRAGVDWYRLLNIEFPELSDEPPRYGWFSIEEMGDLAFGRGERREQREGF